MEEEQKVEIKQPVPRQGVDISYVCRYEHEIDRRLILDTMSDYIEKVFSTKNPNEIFFVKIPMEAVNQVFTLSKEFPGEELEFDIDYKNNNVKQITEIFGNDLPCIWSVMENKDTGLKMIATIEPCKFIVKSSDIDLLREVLSKVEIAPKEYNVQSLDDVHWNEQTEILRKDFEFFTSSRRWFLSKGISYNRSYLLHGPPGNGKTTTIKAFAKYLNVSPELFDFTASHTSPDKAFQAWILGESERIARDELDEMLANAKYGEDESEDDDEDNPTPLRLLILEDLDRFYPVDGQAQTQVSLSCILNSLDGSIERRNTIIIATANHPESLDRQVLVRPGRFDKQIEYRHPTKEHALSYLIELFKDEEVTPDVLDKVCDSLNGQSYAFHKELFTSSASHAFSRSSKVISNEDVLNGLEDLIANTPMAIMKSEKSRFGF